MIVKKINFLFVFSVEIDGCIVEHSSFLYHNQNKMYYKLIKICKQVEYY